MAPTKLIIDTDPGNDDMMAMLLALSSKPEEIEVPLISVTYGNVDAQNCLRNVVTMFHVIEREIEWRKANGLPEGFDTLRKTKPIVAVGATAPLGDQRIQADFFHGLDGLANVHTTHPHFTPADTWRHLFERPAVTDPLQDAAPVDPPSEPPSQLFTASNEYSWREILRILRENPPDTVSIATIGPMTNVALAASEDPLTLMRAKEIIVMGGAVLKHGNITPMAEFNTFADAHAAAYVYALSSPNPRSTAPPKISPSEAYLSGKDAPPEAAGLKDLPTAAALGERRLKIVLFPLDITEDHLLYQEDWDARVEQLHKRESPLAMWMHAWASATYAKVGTLHPGAERLYFELHDPMCIWYALDGDRNRLNWKVKRDVDIRVECNGQWARGACVVDRRPNRVMRDDSYEEGPDSPGDHGGWSSTARGNRLGWCVGSPGEELLSQLLREIILPHA